MAGCGAPQTAVAPGSASGSSVARAAPHSARSPKRAGGTSRHRDVAAGSAAYSGPGTVSPKNATSSAQGAPQIAGPGAPDPAPRLRAVIESRSFPLGCWCMRRERRQWPVALAGPTLPVMLDSGLAVSRRPKPNAVLRGPATGEAKSDGAARCPRPSAAPGHHPWLAPKAFGRLTQEIYRRSVWSVDDPRPMSQPWLGHRPPLALLPRPVHRAVNDPIRHDTGGRAQHQLDPEGICRLGPLAVPDGHDLLSRGEPAAPLASRPMTPLIPLRGA